MSIKIFDGSSWKNSKLVKLYDGATWQFAKKAFTWNGSAWVEIYSGQSNISLPEFTWSAGSFGSGVGQTVSVSNGTWAIPPESYKYQWQKGYNVQGSTTQWEDLPNGTSSSYLLTASQVGYFIRCKVIAVNGSSDSEPVYASIDSSPLPPQEIKNSTALVSSNGVIRFFWDVSEGADSYLVSYQGPGIPRTEVLIDGKVNNLYDKDFGVPDESFLIGKTTLGISVYPVNNTSPALSWWRWATANENFKFTGNGSSKDILDLLPNKPSATSTIEAISPYVYDTALRINWTTSNITQTGYEIYYETFNDEVNEMQWIWYRGPVTSASNFAYIQTGAGVETGPWKVRVYGTARGFSGYIDAVAGKATSANVKPTSGSAFLSANGAVYPGTTLYGSTSGWTPNPTSTSVSIVGDSYRTPTSISDGFVFATGVSPSYTVNALDVEAGTRFRAFATATNSAGTSDVVASAQVATATQNPPASVVVPNFVGQTSASNGPNYVIYYASGTGTSNQSLVGKIASQSPGAGTYSVAQNQLPLTVSVSFYVYQEPEVEYVYAPNYVGTYTADGTYGDWTLTTNQNTGTTDYTLDGKIVAQSPIAGSAYDKRYISLPASISINRYQYQAPGYAIYVRCNGFSGAYSGGYGSPSGGSGMSYIYGQTQNPNLSSDQIIAILGVPNACYVPPFGFTPFGFTPFGFTPFGFTPFGFTPFGFTPFGFTPVKSIGADTLIASKVPEGLVLAHNLAVGDVLYSADIENLDSHSNLGLSEYFADWSETNPVINTNLETTIVGLSARIVDNVVVINGNKYSYSHYIMVKRNEEVKFVKVYEVEFTDQIFSPMIDAWQPILELRNAEGKELVISINTEPYDIFFTDNAIVHDSHPFDANTPGAIFDKESSLSGSLESLYQEWKLSQENPAVE
jgi:hypothetical protein